MSRDIVQLVERLIWDQEVARSSRVIPITPVVSTFCNYVMLMYEEEYPTFRNFTVGLKVVQTGYVHEKVPLTPDEYINLCKELEKREEWQKLAYLVFL